jgi:transcriptional regulator with XRE-family HTH domain
MDGAKIRQLRVALDLTQEELGEMIGAAAVTISRWENMHHIPSPLAQKALAALRIEQDQARLVTQEQV